MSRPSLSSEQVPATSSEMISRSFAASLNNIGALHHERGNIDEAVKFYRRALMERMASLQPQQSGSCGWRAEHDDWNPSDKQMQLLRAANEERRLEATRLAQNERTGLLLDIYQQSDESVLSQFSFDKAILIRSNAYKCQSGLEYSVVALYNLGLLHCQTNNFDSALELFQTCLIASAKVVIYKEIASLVHNGIGQILLHQGQHERSISHFMRAAQMDLAVLKQPMSKFDCQGRSLSELSSKRRLGRTHSNLGRVYFRMGEYDRAMYHCKESLRVRIESLGIDHIDVAATLCNIGLIFREMGELGEALDHCRWFIHVGRDKLGKQHPQVLSALKCISEIRSEINMFGGRNNAAAAA